MNVFFATFYIVWVYGTQIQNTPINIPILLIKICEEIEFIVENLKKAEKVRLSMWPNIQTKTLHMLVNVVNMEQVEINKIVGYTTLIDNVPVADNSFRTTV